MASYDDKQTDKALEELQQRIIENYQNAYDEISKTAADYWRDFMPRYNEERKAYEAGKGGYADEKTAKAKFDAWTLAQYGRGERWDNLRDKIATRLNDANKTASAYIKDTTPGIYELNANYSAYLIEEATGVDFTLYDERTVADLIQGKTQILPPSKVNDAKTNAYIQNQLTKAVTSGILQGQPIDKIAKQFERVTQMNANAAIRNARTAVTSAQNAGRQDTYERAAEMGIEIEKEWIATVDDRTRDSHAELDGVRVKIDELYPNGLNYPADPSGAPEEVYNCRCTQRAIIAKYNGQARETVIDGHEGTHTKATYEQWKADKIAAQPPTTHADATARAMEAKEDAQEAAAEEALNEFTPATTKAEAEEYAKQFADRVDYTGISLENANIINETLTELTAKYPINQLNNISPRTGKAVASANYNHLHINGRLIGSNGMDNFIALQNQYTKTIEMIKERYTNGRIPPDMQRKINVAENTLKYSRWGVSDTYPGQEARATIIHEYGHIIADQYFGQINMSTGNEHFWSNPEVSKTVDAWEDTYLQAKRNGDIFNISNYGGTNSHEFFSECFCAFEMGETLPDYIEEELRGILNAGIL